MCGRRSDLIHAQARVDYARARVVKAALHWHRHKFQSSTARARDLIDKHTQEGQLSGYRLTIAGHEITASMAQWRETAKAISALEHANYQAWVESLRAAGSLWVAEYCPEGSGASCKQEFDSLDRLLAYFDYGSDRSVGYDDPDYCHGDSVMFLERIQLPDGNWLDERETDRVRDERRTPSMLRRPPGEQARVVEVTDLTERYWRTGRRVGRTVYAQLGDQPSDHDPLIGVMDTAELAAAAVDAHNRMIGQEAEQ